MSEYLTDEQYKECVPCYCNRCGTQLWMHVLFPQIGSKSLEHYCVAKPPVVFEVTLIEVKPMEIPVSKILDPEWNRQQWQDFKSSLRKMDDHE